MGLSREKRYRIKNYILEKIETRDKEIVPKTAETFSISLNTVYRYLKELEKDKIIKKSNKPETKYVLVKNVKYFLYKPKEVKLEEHEVYYNDINSYVKDLPINIQRIWEYSFMEMFNNAIDHSESDQIICLVIRDYLHTSIAIQDNGIGIFEKIRSFYNYKTLDDAITELFKGKLTTDSKNHSGEGIFFTSRILDIFGAISCDKIFTHNNYSDVLEDLVNTKLINNSQFFKDRKGTAVMMILSNHTTKQLKEVFDMYSDVDGGFNKTEIPIKNVFESGYPVSRSQAKRLSNRFDKFKEIILDFAEVAEIGQGFSHELFVVFQNNNPSVNLKVINANDDVKKMINHVKLSNNNSN